MSILKASSDGVLVSCRAMPRSSRNAVVGILGDALKIAVTAPPVEGKANSALCEVLADFFQVPKRTVSVKNGATGKNKILLVSGLAVSAAEQQLNKSGFLQ